MRTIYSITRSNGDIPSDERKLSRRFRKHKRKFQVEHTDKREKHERKLLKAKRRAIKAKIKNARELAQSLAQNRSTSADQQIPDSFTCVHCGTNVQKPDKPPLGLLVYVIN
ncbi:hypothetical protein HD806DRAFT_499352 [Xylariaceae sp. AK1471]|nr:hypothetical protein HD806DRAFT_499352 [Xylariaceae sp. AK1471]